MVNSDNPSNDHVTLWSCYSLHKASQKPNHRQNILLPARFFGDLHYGQRAHQQERLPTIYHPVEASPENTFPCVDAWRRVRHCLDTRLLRLVRLSPPSPSIHSTCPAFARKAFLFHFFSPTTVFAFFLSPESPFFLCFLKLYDIFKTLGVVFC